MDMMYGSGVPCQACQPLPLAKGNGFFISQFINRPCPSLVTAELANSNVAVPMALVMIPTPITSKLGEPENTGIPFVVRLLIVML